MYSVCYDSIELKGGMGVGVGEGVEENFGNDGVGEEAP